MILGTQIGHIWSEWTSSTFHSRKKIRKSVYDGWKPVGDQHKDQAVSLWILWQRTRTSTLNILSVKKGPIEWRNLGVVLWCQAKKHPSQWETDTEKGSYVVCRAAPWWFCCLQRMAWPLAQTEQCSRSQPGWWEDTIDSHKIPLV
jgi:hypothetical protein